MYFSHAFRKSFLGKSNGGVLSVASTGTTATLSAGQLGLFKASNYSVITAAPASNTPFILAQGSYFTNDKIGPHHGGYQESVKSKMINPKYISRVFTTCAVAPQAQVITIGWDLDAGPGFAFECGKTYRLRIDLKGNPALRFLSHNIYRVLDSFSGCCEDDCTAGCTGDPVDAACVLLGWKDRITRDPIMSKFVSPKVFVDNTGPDEVFSAWDVERGANNSEAAYTCVTGAGAADVVAGLELTVAYADTRFETCTFTPTDHYELMPLMIYASVLDETGDPCAIKPIGNSSTGELVTQTQAPKQAEGTGESVIRDLILSNRYRQEAFPDSGRVEHLRMREIEVPSVYKDFDKTDYYNTINILHNVPRLNNPTGVFDNDQYLLTIYVEESINATAFLDLIQDILDGAGMGVTIEHLTSTGNPCSTFTTTTTTSTTTTTTTAP